MPTFKAPCLLSIALERFQAGLSGFNQYEPKIWCIYNNVRSCAQAMNHVLYLFGLVFIYFITKLLFYIYLHTWNGNLYYIFILCCMHPDCDVAEPKRRYYLFHNWAFILHIAHTWNGMNRKFDAPYVKRQPLLYLYSGSLDWYLFIS